jgi:hypothetical protein
MKKASFACTLILIIIVSVLAIISSMFAYAEPSTGVKKGDWIEYSFSITGPPLEPLRNLTWYRTEILEVDGTWFRANKTALLVNGSFSSSIWNFNLTEGQVQSWAIIPANLSPGDTFFDIAKSANITIEGEEQKTLLNASRTITHASEPDIVYREWDKATGFYVHAATCNNNYNVTSNLVATNLWSPELILGLKPPVFYALVTVTTVMALFILTSAILERKNNIRTHTLSASSQRKIAVLTIVMVIVFEVASMFMFPVFAAGLNTAEINLIMQTVWTGLVFMSMWFRMKDNYFMHEITMLIVICAWWIGVSFVLLMNPFSTSTEVFSNTPLRLVMNALHGIFSIPALIFGTWLVAIWRPASTTFPAKSRRLAQLTIICWIPSYIVGILDFMVLHTTIFG